MAAPPFTFDAELAQYCIFDVAGIHMHIHHDAFSAGVSEMRERISAWQGMELAAAAADIAMVHSANDYQFRFARHLTLCSGGCSCTTVSTDPSFDAVVIRDGFHHTQEVSLEIERLWTDAKCIGIWPLRSQERLPTCEQISCDIMFACNLISRTRAFAKRMLQMLLPCAQPRPLPLRPTRVLHNAAAPAASLCNDVAAAHHLCNDVAAAARRRMRCSETVFIAARLATIHTFRQCAGDGCRFSDAIVDRVIRGYCRQMQVVNCMQCCSSSVVAPAVFSLTCMCSLVCIRFS